MVWLCKTKTQWKSNFVLYSYRQSSCIYKRKYFYKDIIEDVESRFDSSNYESDRPLPKGKNKKVTRLMKDKLGGKIDKIFWIKSKNV